MNENEARFPIDEGDPPADIVFTTTPTPGEPDPMMPGILHNKRSLEAALRCNFLGYNEAVGAPARLGLPLDLTTETRDVIERAAIPAALMLSVGESNIEIEHAIFNYEGMLQTRRIGLELPAGVTYYDRFQAEKALITAISIAASVHFASYGWRVRAADFPSTNSGFFPDAGLLLGEPGNETLMVFRVTSRHDDDRRAKLDYPAILTWRESRAEFLAVQYVVVGSVGKDLCYEMPFTRRWVDRNTGQKAWKGTYEDAAGSTKRLGKSWEKEAVPATAAEEWIDELLELSPEAMTAVFPTAQKFQPSPRLQASAQSYLDMVRARPEERNTRGCLFPNECPLLASCWGL